jgi:antitoxin (DNA-binding transcriptional repressor) of toxin-antitoxin stability system
MIYEIDVEDAGARFAELIETIDAGFGVLIKRGGEVVARLAPESAFREMEGAEDASLTPEQREAKETLEAFQAQIEDEF